MNIKDSTMPFVMGTVAGAVLTMVVGFNWGGWVTGGMAADMSQDAAKTAVASAFAPLCLAKAQDDPEYTVKLTAFNEESSYQRDDYIEEAGWANNIGVPDDFIDDVVDACVTLIGANKV